MAVLTLRPDARTTATSMSVTQRSGLKSAAPSVAEGLFAGAWWMSSNRWARWPSSVKRSFEGDLGRPALGPFGVAAFAHMTGAVRAFPASGMNVCLVGSGFSFPKRIDASRRCRLT